MKYIISPTNKEIKIKKNKYILSSTDTKGNILSVNDYFIDVCQYTKDELIGSPHNIIRHPDMPKAIFYLMWDQIKQGKKITAVVKNMTKNGDFYWVITDFIVKRNSENKIDRYFAIREYVPKKILTTIEHLYKKLLEIEKADDMRTSVEYLSNFLKEQNMSYNQYIEKLKKQSGLKLAVTNVFRSFFQ